MINILFFGDIVGKLGREMIKKYLPDLKKQYQVDLVIVNGENATHGKGLIEKHYHELLSYGVDVITLGNHYNSKIDIYHFIDAADRLVKPLNLLDTIGGKIAFFQEVKGIKIGVLNVLGTVFMKNEVKNPYLATKEIVDANSDALIVVDFHAEATSEKICFGYVFDGKVAAVIGTHTHVQTNDAKILKEGTAFISDVGMCGAANGVLGFERNSVVQKTIFGNTSRFLLDENDNGQINACIIQIDEIKRRAVNIVPIKIIDERK